MAASSEQGIIRVLRTNLRTADADAHVGMGILVSETLIVTCAHVVNEALGRDTYADASPDHGTEVRITFPILNDDQEAVATLVGWSSPRRTGLDCAILKLEKSAPKGVGHSILSVIPRADLLDAKLSVFGSLDPGHPGSHTSAELLGNVGGGWSQLEIKGRFGVEPGFSGGAVWDINQHTSIGMIVARKAGSQGTIGYFLPAARIAEEFGDLVPVEVRRTRLTSQVTFSFVAILLFVLMLIHHMAMQGTASNALVPWAGGSKELAGFFGVHMFAVILGPFVMVHAYWHARSFAMRRWWQRVPVAFGGKSANMLNHNRFTASMVCLFLLFLPAYGQGAALNRVFLHERPVFVNVARFDAIKHCAGGPGNSERVGCENVGVCNSIDGNWCRHSDVSTMSFIPSLPYFNHVYQIGGSCIAGVNCRLVTFFPLLQPLILFASTAVAYLFFFLFLAALIRAWPHSLPSSEGN